MDSASAIDSICEESLPEVAGAVEPPGIPAEMFPELEHGLPGVALKANREARVLQRHREPFRRGGGGGAAWPARSARPSRNSQGLPNAPRPIITPAHRV